MFQIIKNKYELKVFEKIIKSKYLKKFVVISEILKKDVFRKWLFE